MRKPSCRAAAAKSSTTPCCSKIGLKRGPWTPEEDELLSNYIQKEGEGRWRTLPKRAGLLRCGKSCRLRWMNYLRPSVKRGHIAPDEEDLILRLHRLLGNRWSLIAGRIPGRTDNEIKNYWNTHLSKKLISQGIDPRTHKPLPPHNNITITNNALPSPTKPNPNPITITDHHEHDPNPYSHPLHPYDHQLSDLPAIPLPNTPSNPMDDDDDDINYCTDDVFSSFINSLINDDAFSSAQHHHPPPPPPPYHAVAWESSLVSAARHHDPNNMPDHAGADADADADADAVL